MKTLPSPLSSSKTRLAWAVLFLAYCVFSVIDLVLDWDEAGVFHKSVEIAMLALSTLITLSFTQAYRRKTNENLILSGQLKDQSTLIKEREQWKLESQKWKQGISQGIDRQLDSWSLTPAEKEIALLLLKGLSLRDISELRSVSEKTVRAQTLSIYAKSGLQGRAELSAFFLEDVLVLPNG